MPAHKLSHPWKLLPLYGLRITEDDGLKDPIFGDATLLSLEAATELLTEIANAEGARIAIHPMISMMADAPKIPREYLLEVTPDSFIAVLRADGEDAIRRAGEIRALFTATLVLRGGLLGAFSDSPANLAWSLGHAFIEGNKEGNLSFGKSYRVNTHVMTTPLSFTKDALRASWLEGKPLEPVPEAHGSWDFHKIHPICRLLGGSEFDSKWANRLRALAGHLNEACFAPTYEHQVMMAITCVEGILGAGGHHEKKLKPRLGVFGFREEGAAIGVETLLEARNLYIHEGKALENPVMYARFALTMSWLLLDHAALFVSHKPSREEWESQLDMLVSLTPFMKLVAKNYSEDDASAMELKMRELRGKYLPGRLTVMRG